MPTTLGTGEFVDNLQVDGRDRAIMLWREAKEEKEYAKLFQRLYQRNWAAKTLKDTARRKRRNAIQRRWRQNNRTTRLAKEREKRRQAYEADPVINQCRVCGAVWVVPYGRRGQKQSVYCSRKCANRWHGALRTKRRRQAKDRK